jgi:hypothetical protein
MTTGIYCIENMLNNHKYIGKSHNIEQRWREHVWCLDAKIHDDEVNAARCYDRYVIDNNLSKPLNFPRSKKRTLSMDFSKKNERRKRGTRPDIYLS